MNKMPKGKEMTKDERMMPPMPKERPMSPEEVKNMVKKMHGSKKM